MNFAVSGLSASQALENIYEGAVGICTTAPSILLSKITRCVKDVFRSEHSFARSVWSYSLLSAIRLSLPEQSGFIGSALDLLCGLSGAATVFNAGRKGLEVYGALAEGAFMEYLNHNLVPHCRTGFVFDRKCLWITSVGIHAIVIPTLILQTNALDKHKPALLLAHFYRLTGMACTVATCLRKLEELGHKFQQKKIIANSKEEERKILIVEAEMDPNEALFPDDRFLVMLKKLAGTCKIERIIVGSKQDFERAAKNFSSTKFSVVWMRTHSSGENENIGERLLFSDDFQIEDGKELLCLQKLAKKDVKILLEGCSLAQKKEKNSLSFAESVSNALQADVYSSLKPVVHLELMWNEEDFQVQLLDKDENDITTRIAPQGNK